MGNFEVWDRKLNKEIKHGFIFKTPVTAHFCPIKFLFKTPIPIFVGLELIFNGMEVVSVKKRL
jgi:hypothetical protein